MNENIELNKPKWVRDFEHLIYVKSQFVVHGNIRDNYPYVINGQQHLLPFDTCLSASLKEKFDFDAVLSWDFLDGLSVVSKSENLQHDNLASSLGLSGSAPWDIAINAFPNIVKRVASNESLKLVLIVEMSSRLFTDGASDASVNKVFSQAEKSSIHPMSFAHGTETEPLQLTNLIVWKANLLSDIPFWFTAENNNIHSIGLSFPSTEIRKSVAKVVVDDLSLWENNTGEAIRSLTLGTSGLMVKDIQSILKLCKDLSLPAEEIEEAILSYKLGDLGASNPWKATALVEQIKTATEKLSAKVKGQQKAIIKATDILKRTVVGLTAAHTANAGQKPRGVMFFAGPTGVGKTELAKAITSLIFNSQDAYLRFDMSEFSAEHSADRLIGAPPGYVGFDQGGELTNAMKANPFRVILFDEVEKAHPKILDKFLQILEDGRLTDGRGETVYFSDSLIVFTSNAGISKRDSFGEIQYLVKQSDLPEEFEATVQRGVKDYFFNELRRPELLNRIGQNVVVFNFITKEVGTEILQLMTDQVRMTVKEQLDIELTLSDSAIENLENFCLSNLEYGGRGIGANLENVLVNPLARKLFDMNAQGKSSVLITGIIREDGIYSVECT